MDTHYVIIAFESTHTALAAIKELDDLRPTVIPTPRQISAGCGISARVANSNAFILYKRLLDAGFLNDEFTLYAASDFSLLDPGSGGMDQIRQGGTPV